jgi:membrane protein DedA with SNARE-associated domain
MESLFQFFLQFQGIPAYLIVFGILLLCGLGVPIPEDLTLMGAGLLAYHGMANVWLMIIVGMAGVLIGDFTIYYFGIKYGGHLAGHRILSRLLSKERLAWASENFQKRGTKLLFAARFMPGFRAAIFFSAGTLKVPFKYLLIYNSETAFLNIPLIVYAIYH